MKKTILHIVEPFATGTFMFVVNLSNEQCNNYNVIIAHGIRSETHKNYRDFFDPRIKLIRVQNFQQQIKPKNVYQAVKELRKIIKETHPDIIHMHSSQSGVIGKLASFNYKALKLYSPHGFSFLKQDVAPWKRFIFKSIERFFALFNCTLVASSNTEYEVGKSITSKIKLITNGISTDSLDPFLSKQRKSTQFTIGTVGRIMPQKNPSFFNELASKLPDIHFEWIGEGELRSELKSPNIHIVGWGPRDEALEYVSQCDIYIMTSLWEGMPISLLEAMYLKKPCIVTNVVGNRDVIVNEHNGYVCNDINEFIEKIDYLRKKPDISHMLGENAHQDILNNYTNKILVQKYDKLIESLS